MGFGKRVCGILAAVALLALAGAAAWYVFSGIYGKSYEDQGTLVQLEADECLDSLLEEGAGKEAWPAFVTDPKAMIYGEYETIRSSKGL